MEKKGLVRLPDLAREKDVKVFTITSWLRYNGRKVHIFLEGNRMASYASKKDVENWLKSRQPRDRSNYRKPVKIQVDFGEI